MEQATPQQLLHLMLSNCPDVMMLFDACGRYVSCTDWFLALSGIDDYAKIDGCSYQEVFRRFATPEWIDQFHARFLEAMRLGTGAGPAMDATLDIGLSGKPRRYAIRITPMLDDARVAKGAIVRFNDLTEILAAKDAAEAANRAKSNFFASVSHEVRTPMNAIIGLTDMLQRTRLDEEQQSLATSVQHAANKLLSLLNNVLDFATVEEDGIQLNEEYFSLFGLLESLKQAYTVLFGEKRLRFTCVLSKGLPDVVYGDEQRVRQILDNVIQNALKFTAEGGARLSAYADEDNMLCFDIVDTGIGIAEDVLPKVFSPFEALHAKGATRISGSGLSLAITRALCERMGGSIAVESEPGKGSAISICLPLRIGTADDLKDPGDRDASFTAPDARVLVVDDIEINLMVTAALLSSFGIECDQAYSGAEALSMLQGAHYDMVFMDHMMPGMDGIETTQAIRTMSGFDHAVPIVALTANAAHGARDMFLASGFNDYLPKPINRDALGGCLYRWLPEALLVEEEG